MSFHYQRELSNAFLMNINQLTQQIIVNSALLLCPDENSIVTVFLWIKSYVNFQPTTQVHKKCAVMRRV